MNYTASENLFGKLTKKFSIKESTISLSMKTSVTSEKNYFRRQSKECSQQISIYLDNEWKYCISVKKSKETNPILIKMAKPFFDLLEFDYCKFSIIPKLQ